MPEEFSRIGWSDEQVAAMAVHFARRDAQSDGEMILLDDGFMRRCAVDCALCDQLWERHLGI